MPHHGFDLVDPGEPTRRPLFQAFARHCIRDIDARGKRAVLCGGTGQYVQAAIDDFAFPKGRPGGKTPSANAGPPMRRTRQPSPVEEALGARSLAPPSSHPNNVRRVVRAFELWRRCQLRRAETAARHRGALRSSRAIRAGRGAKLYLNERIDARVDAMVARRARRRGAGPAGRRIPRRRHAQAIRIQRRSSGAGWEHHARGGRAGHQDGHAPPLRQKPAYVVSAAISASAG